MLYSLRDIQVHRSDRCILDIKKLDIMAEKVYSLVGPNGAGKSTLLNILGFLMKPDAGTIACNDVLVHYSSKSYHQLRQKIVLVEQYPILFTGSVWKNIDFALKMRKISKQQRNTRIREVLEQVGMQAFANADAHKLSGGETKRIALARALALEPEVLLCDEPTANVDTENQERIIEILEYCNKQQKTTLIFATHYLSQAQRLTDCSIVLQNGSVSSTGNDNIFPARIVNRTQGIDTWLVGEDLPITVPQKTTTTGQVNCRIQIDPRCIDITKSSHSLPASAVHWKGKIIKITGENEAVRITVDCGIRIDVVLCQDVYTREQLMVRESVYLQIAPEKCVFL